MQDASDETLFANFRSGDEAALGELANRYERSLLGIACGLLRNDREAARDAVQETWLRVIRYAGSFRERSAFRTWLYRILINQSRTIAQRMARDRVEVALGDPPSECAPERPSVSDAVARLDEDKREVLLLCHHRGLTHEQVASILDLPIGTVKSRLHAAVRALRERLSMEMIHD